MISFLRRCCVTRLNNGCEENKFLMRCIANVEPIFLIHKEAKRIKRQLDMRLIAEHVTVRAIKKIWSTMRTCVRRGIMSHALAFIFPQRVR